MSKFYNAYARAMSKVNLCEAGMMYPVDLTKLTKEQREELWWVEEDDDVVLVSAADIENYQIPYEAVDYCGGEYWEEDAEELLAGLIKPADHYLVFASGVRWNGASGYKVCKDRKSCVSRNYEATITPVGASRGGKALVCRESSHDVPMGSTTVIVALTDAEARRIEEMSFDEVEEFVDKCRAKVA